MNEPAEPDLSAAAATLEQIERLTRRLRQQLGDPETPKRRRRGVMLREAALRALPSDRWMTLDEWEERLGEMGYAPARKFKRADQTRRSLASLAARNRHLIDSDGHGKYRLAAPAPEAARFA